MEKLANHLDNQLAMRPTTNGQLERPSNSSSRLSPRQAALLTLIQKTQTRRGLPLIAGPEIPIALAAWEDALKIVPDGYLARSYEAAVENFKWGDRWRQFTPDVIKPYFRTLLEEDQRRAAAELRNAARRNPETYRCWHCSDLGYQNLYYRMRDRWYSGSRACSCEIAPNNQRNEEPLQEPEWMRNRLGEYVRRAELIKYGAPNENFENVTYAGQGAND